MNNSENNSFRFRLIGIDTIRLAIPEEQMNYSTPWSRDVSAAAAALNRNERTSI